MTQRNQLDARSAVRLLEAVRAPLAALGRQRAVYGRTQADAPARPRSILVTGASGFLGTHLLAELVARESFTHIKVLVRDPAKLETQLAHYGLHVGTAQHVEPVVGDLRTMPLDALPAVDVVLHGAARIHCLQPLTRLWGDNVETTLRVCQRYGAQPTRLAFVSSLSVFVSSNLTGVHRPESLSLATDYTLIGGYAQSKFIGEKLVEAVGGDIIRPGLLTGSSVLGRFPAQDFFTMFVHTLRGLGTYPRPYTEAWVDVTPVDYAARAMADLVSRAGGGGPDITHLANPQSVPLSALVELLDLRPVPLETFCQQLLALPRIPQMLLTYAFFKPEALAQYPHYFNVDLFQSTGHDYAVPRAFEISNAALLATYRKALASKA